MLQTTSRSPKRKSEQWRKIWVKLGLWQSGKNRRNCYRKSLCCTLCKRSLWELMDCCFIVTEKEEIWSLASKKKYWTESPCLWYIFGIFWYIFGRMIPGCGHIQYYLCWVVQKEQGLGFQGIIKKVIQYSYYKTTIESPRELSLLHNVSFFWWIL